ncbi:MAG TPA: hypothetical protein VIK92_03565 [Thermaerobacter sp.]
MAEPMGNPVYTGPVHPAQPAAAQPAVQEQGAAPGRKIDFHRLPPQEQRQALLELVRDGRNDEEIGALFGMSQWQVRNLRYRLGIKKDRGGNVHLEPIRLRAGVTPIMDPEAGLEGEAGGNRLALTLDGEFDGTTLAGYLEGITSFVGAAGSRPFRVRLAVYEARTQES